MLTKLREEFSFIRGNFLILVISWVLMDFAMEMPYTYESLYVLELGATEFILGVIGFVSLIVLAFVQFPGGYLADKYGRRRWIVTMTFGVALSYIFYAVAPTWRVILIGAVLMNLCLIYEPAIEAMTMDSLPPEKRGMGYSVNMLITRVATTPAPILAGFLLAGYGLVYGMRIAYTIVVVLFLIAAALRTRLQETIRDPVKIELREVLNSYPKAIRESIAVWDVVPRSVLYLFLATLFVTFSSAMSNRYFVVYVTKILKIEQFTWALLSTYLVIFMICFALPAGKLVDKVGRKTPLLASFLFFVPAVLLFVYGDLSRLLIAFPLMGVGQILINTAYSSLQADLIPREQRGKVLGSTNFVNYVVMSLGQLVGGFVYYYVSPKLPFLLLLVFMIPAFFLILFLVHEPEKREV